MATSSPEAQFIAARSAKLCEAYNTKDIDTALSKFVDEGLEYSDFGVMALNMNKTALRSFLDAMMKTCIGLKLTTLSVSGHKGFSAWEWNLEFSKEGESQWEEINNANDGKSSVIKMRGVSLTWWDEAGEKIVKNHDYARVV